MAIVYQHKRNDTGEVFYVGIGKTEARAYSDKRRGKFWNDFTKNHSYSVEITHRDIIWEEACSIERYLIAFYGRRDLNEGCLVNMTDGGEGTLGIQKKGSDEFKEKCRNNLKGKTWEERLGPEKAAEMKRKAADRTRERGVLTKYITENGAPNKGKKMGSHNKERIEKMIETHKKNWESKTPEQKAKQLRGIVK